MTILLAIFLGTLFGFVLQKNGVSSTENLNNMLTLKDFSTMKKILTGIGLSSFMAFLALQVGLLDASNFSVKAMNLGVIVGGAIFGLGWGIANYCPGTAVVALGEGKKDALYFVLGGLLGAFVFMLAYDSLVATGMFEAMFGGKVSLLETNNSKFDNLIEINPTIGSLIISSVFVGIALLLPNEKQQ